jgi:hypothetical protein
LAAQRGFGTYEKHTAAYHLKINTIGPYSWHFHLFPFSVPQYIVFKASYCFGTNRKLQFRNKNNIFSINPIYHLNIYALKL